MSALGQKRTLKRLHPMSALPPKADVVSRNGDVRFVPIADIANFQFTGCASGNFHVPLRISARGR